MIQHWRFLRLILLALVLALVLGVTGCGGDDSEPSAADEPAAGETESAEPAESTETFELQLAHYIGPNAAQSVSIERWAEEINEKTDGRVTIKMFYQGALLDPTDMLQGVASGRADLGYLASSYFPAELPLASIVDIPFVTSNPDAQTKTFTELYASNEAFQNEYEELGLKIMTFNPLTATVLGSTEAIEGTDGVEGKKVRVAGNIGVALALLGADPVALGAPEIYEALQRGLIDAYSSFPFEVVADLALHEVAPFVIDPELGNFAISATVMNLETWESLPPDIQEVFAEANAGHIDNAMEDLREVEVRVCDTLLEAGGSAVLWPEADVAAWQEQIGDSLRDKWLEAAAASIGQEPAEAFSDEYLETLEDLEAESEYTPGVRACAERG